MISERETAVGEGEAIMAFVARLREAVAAEQAPAGCDRARWGQVSAQWNREQRAFVTGFQRCVVRSRLHYQMHLIGARLFPAWQDVHHTLTRGKPADTRSLDALEEEVRRTLAAARPA